MPRASIATSAHPLHLILTDFCLTTNSTFYFKVTMRIKYKSQDFISFAAGSWSPSIVLLMALFLFDYYYYSEYLTHLCSQGDPIQPLATCEAPTGYSFLLLSPIVSSLLATATVSNCFLLSDFPPFLLPPLLTLSSVIYFPAADKWSSLRSTKEYSEISHQAQKEKNKKRCFLNEESFFNKTQKAIKLR